MSSHTGSIFTITTFGESHGPAIGAVIDGCPAGITLDLSAIQEQLNRRKPGQSSLTTPRREADDFELLSGLYEGKTLGTPLAFVVRNSDAKGGDYKRWEDVYRPGHADYTYEAKYGHRNPLGGGRASARETIGRVLGGAIAEQILRLQYGIEIIAWTESVGDVRWEGSFPESRRQVDQNHVRCPHPEKARQMEELIEQVKGQGDSIGGTVSLIIRNVPPGVGDPAFDRLEANLAKAFLSIPACKGVESGSGFEGSRQKGSDHNDLFVPVDSPSRDEKLETLKKEFPDSGILRTPALTTSSNRSGGIQGGISNGSVITFRLAFKPTATIRMDQSTVNRSGEAVNLKAGGRHDPCVVPRAIPIVEAMAALTLLDSIFLQRAVHPEWHLRYEKNEQ